MDNPEKQITTTHVFNNTNPRKYPQTRKIVYKRNGGEMAESPAFIDESDNESLRPVHGHSHKMVKEVSSRGVNNASYAKMLVQEVSMTYTGIRGASPPPPSTHVDVARPIQVETNLSLPSPRPRSRSNTTGSLRDYLASYDARVSAEESVDRLTASGRHETEFPVRIAYIGSEPLSPQSVYRVPIVTDSRATTARLGSSLGSLLTETTEQRYEAFSTRRSDMSASPNNVNALKAQFERTAREQEREAQRSAQKRSPNTVVVMKPSPVYQATYGSDSERSMRTTSDDRVRRVERQVYSPSDERSVLTTTVVDIEPPNYGRRSVQKGKYIEETYQEEIRSIKTYTPGKSPTGYIDRGHAGHEVQISRSATSNDNRAISPVKAVVEKFESHTEESGTQRRPPMVDTIRKEIIMQSYTSESRSGGVDRHADEERIRRQEERKRIEEDERRRLEEIRIQEERRRVDIEERRRQEEIRIKEERHRELLIIEEQRIEEIRRRRVREREEKEQEEARKREQAERRAHQEEARRLEVIRIEEETLRMKREREENIRIEEEMERRKAEETRIKLEEDRRYREQEQRRREREEEERRVREERERRQHEEQERQRRLVVEEESRLRREEEIRIIREEEMRIQIIERERREHEEYERHKRQEEELRIAEEQRRQRESEARWQLEEEERVRLIREEEIRIRREEEIRIQYEEEERRRHVEAEERKRVQEEERILRIREEEEIRIRREEERRIRLENEERYRREHEELELRRQQEERERKLREKEEQEEIYRNEMLLEEESRKRQELIELEERRLEALRIEREREEYELRVKEQEERRLDDERRRDEERRRIEEIRITEEHRREEERIRIEHLRIEEERRREQERLDKQRLEAEEKLRIAEERRFEEERREQELIIIEERRIEELRIKRERAEQEEKERKEEDRLRQQRERELEEERRRERLREEERRRQEEIRIKEERAKWEERRRIEEERRIAEERERQEKKKAIEMEKARESSEKKSYTSSVDTTITTKIGGGASPSVIGGGATPTFTSTIGSGAEYDRMQDDYRSTISARPGFNRQNVNNYNTSSSTTSYGGSVSGNRVLKIVNEVSSSTLSGLSPFGQHAASAIRDAREREKKEMSDLNDRLASYIEKVRFLEAQNRKLGSDLDLLRSKWGKDTSSIRTMYESELTEARKLIADTNRQRDDMEKDIRRMIDELAEYRRKYEAALTSRDADRLKIDDLLIKLSALESEINLLKRRISNIEEEVSRVKKDNHRLMGELQRARQDLDQETLNRIDYQNQVQTLLEEIDFIRRVNEQEIRDLQAMASRDTTSENREYFKNELSSAIRDIRQEYDQISSVNRNDMESWYKLKVQEIQTQSVRTNMEQGYAKEEVKRLRTQLGDLRGKLTDLEGRNSLLEKQIQELNYQLEDDQRSYESALNDRDAQIRKMREECQALMVELQMLLDTKQTLDAEIAIYRKMLEGEENRAGLRQLVEQVVKTTGLSHSEEHESMRVIKGETASRTSFQRSAKGNVSIQETSPDGKFIVLENTHRSRDEPLGDWKLKRKIDGKREIVYTFPPHFVLRPSKSVKIYARGHGVHGPDALVFEGEDSFGTGSNVQTILFNSSGEERATHIQRSSRD